MIFRRNKYKSKSDEELLNSYKSSEDRLIIGELYRRYGHLVFGLCLKITENKNIAEDLTMQVFESLYEKIRKHTISHFKSWLYVVTRNECYLFLRKQKSTKYEETTLNSDHLPQEDEWESIHSKEEQLISLEKAIAQLQEEQRKAVQLFYLEELSYKQIGERLDWDLKKVKSRIQNGKRNIKLYMEEHHVVKSTS